jgi:N-acetylglucosamine kinase-like BadF-type ATPase
MAYFIGFDIGASKSHGVIANQIGEAIAFYEAGPGNHETVGWEGLKAVLEEITGHLMGQASLTPAQIKGAGFGLGGLDWPSQFQPHLDVISSLGLECPITAVNDAVLGIVAGTRSGWGISIISGTGENCWGVDQKRNYGHMTGNNGLMGEYGGAGTIVFQALQAVAKAWGKRGPDTRLSQIFMEHLGANGLDELLEGVVLGKYSLQASDVPLVFQTAENGDKVAIETIRWAGEELADMIIGVARQLNLKNQEFEVVMIGSTFKGGALLIEPMKKTVLNAFPGAKFIRLEAPPVVGAVLLAMESVQEYTPAIRKNLIKSIENLSDW